MRKEEQPEVLPPKQSGEKERRPDFDLSGFVVENSTLEVRYPFALALWDKSGELWGAVQQKWPNITPVHAEPKRTEFQVGDTRLVAEFEQARITTIKPERSLEQFSRDARDFIKLTTHHLRIDVYKRIGFRLVYFKEFKDKRDAMTAFFSLGLLRIPEGKKFEIDEEPVNPQYSLRWESEKRGVMLNCRAETRVIDVEPPAIARDLVKPVHKESSGIVFDIDYYTVAPVEVGQMDAAEWMKHALHLLSRDTKYVFER